jgi:hypothetical protein
MRLQIPLQRLFFVAVWFRLAAQRLDGLALPVDDRP